MYALLAAKIVSAPYASQDILKIQQHQHAKPVLLDVSLAIKLISQFVAHAR